jgi:hypothetical protein
VTNKKSAVGRKPTFSGTSKTSAQHPSRSS